MYVQFWTVSYNETSEKPTDSIKTADIATDCRHKAKARQRNRNTISYGLLVIKLLFCLF